MKLPGFVMWSLTENSNSLIPLPPNNKPWVYNFGWHSWNCDSWRMLPFNLQQWSWWIQDCQKKFSFLLLNACCWATPAPSTNLTNCMSFDPDLQVKQICGQNFLGHWLNYYDKQKKNNKIHIFILEKTWFDQVPS